MSRISFGEPGDTNRNQVIKDNSFFGIWKFLPKTQTDVFSLFCILYLQEMQHSNETTPGCILA